MMTPMPTFTGRIFRLYQRKRLININVNVVVAGLIAIALAKFPVHFVSEWIGDDRKVLISIIAYGIDFVFDIAVYFGLHWIANHWLPTKPKSEAELRHHQAPKPHFFRDVFKVQAERMALVPVFAIVSMGGMWALQHFLEWQASWAFVAAFVAAIFTTRVLHTLLGLYTGTFLDHHERAKRPNTTPDEAVAPDERPRAS
ncbi:MAG: hypothetical protein ACI89L_000774 [Phycisphaerales bacterium]|jgi:hypothetical protein